MVHYCILILILLLVFKKVHCEFEGDEAREEEAIRNSPAYLALMAETQKVMPATGVDPVVQAIIEEAKRFPLEDFEGDPVLLHELHTDTQTSTFSLSSDNNSIVFERKSMDVGSQVIILTPEEDGLLYRNKKRRYVVLRLQDDAGEGAWYSFCYVYLRDYVDPHDKDLRSINLDQGRFVLEWDSWDYRGSGKERFTFGFTNCDMSTIVPCGFNEMISPDAMIEPSKIKHKWVPKSTFLLQGPNLELKRMVTEGKFDIQDNFDFYWDLEVTKEGVWMEDSNENPTVGQVVPKWLGEGEGGNQGGFGTSTGMNSNPNPGQSGRTWESGGQTRNNGQNGNSGQNGNWDQNSQNKNSQGSQANNWIGGGSGQNSQNHNQNANWGNSGSSSGTSQGSQATNWNGGGRNNSQNQNTWGNANTGSNGGGSGQNFQNQNQNTNWGTSGSSSGANSSTGSSGSSWGNSGTNSNSGRKDDYNQLKNLSQIVLEQTPHKDQATVTTGSGQATNSTSSGTGATDATASGPGPGSGSGGGTAATPAPASEPQTQSGTSGSGPEVVKDQKDSDSSKTRDDSASNKNSEGSSASSGSGGSLRSRDYDDYGEKGSSRQWYTSKDQDKGDRDQYSSKDDGGYRDSPRSDRYESGSSGYGNSGYSRDDDSYSSRDRDSYLDSPSRSSGNRASSRYDYDDYRDSPSRSSGSSRDSSRYNYDDYKDSTSSSGTSGSGNRVFSGSGRGFSRSSSSRSNDWRDFDRYPIIGRKRDRYDDDYSDGQSNFKNLSSSGRNYEYRSDSGSSRDGNRGSSYNKEAWRSGSSSGSGSSSNSNGGGFTSGFGNFGAFGGKGFDKIDKLRKIVIGGRSFDSVSKTNENPEQDRYPDRYPNQELNSDTSSSRMSSTSGSNSNRKQGAKKPKSKSVMSRAWGGSGSGKKRTGHRGSGTSTGSGNSGTSASRVKYPQTKKTEFIGGDGDDFWENPDAWRKIIKNKNDTKGQNTGSNGESGSGTESEGGTDKESGSGSSGQESGNVDQSGSDAKNGTKTGGKGSKSDGHGTKTKNGYGTKGEYRIRGQMDGDSELTISHLKYKTSGNKASEKGSNSRNYEDKYNEHEKYDERASSDYKRYQEPNREKRPHRINKAPPQEANPLLPGLLTAEAPPPKLHGEAHKSKEKPAPLPLFHAAAPQPVPISILPPHNDRVPQREAHTVEETMVPPAQVEEHFGGPPEPEVVPSQKYIPGPGLSSGPAIPVPDNNPENNPVNGRGRRLDGKPTPSNPFVPAPVPHSLGRSFSENPTSTGTAYVKAKGDVIANSGSDTGNAQANAVSKVAGYGAIANAINGTSASANSFTTLDGDALSRSETYGAGGAKSNSLASGTGVAQGTTMSKGKGDSEANAIAMSNAAEANSQSDHGGQSAANAISNTQGDALSSSVALEGGSSKSASVANGIGAASSSSQAKGGGSSSALADAKGGGGAEANSQASNGGESHSIATANGGGSSLSTSVTQGGGHTVADTMADSGDSIANAIQDDDDDDNGSPLDPELFVDKVADMPDDTFNMIHPHGRGFKGPSPAQRKKQGRGYSAKQKQEKPLVYLPGWKTQYMAKEPNVTFTYESDIFYGLASCPHKAVQISDLDIANSPEQVVKFYMTVLRSWCLDEEYELIMNLIKDGAIEVKGQLLVAKEDSVLATKRKLNSHQLNELAMAFELCVFSHLFQEQRNNQPSPVSRRATQAPVTRSVRFLVDFILKGVDISRQKNRAHFIALTRQLILITKVAYTKLLQDFDFLDSCNSCDADKEYNHADREEVMAILEFLIKGLSPVDKGEGAVVAFEKFFRMNQGAIEIRVSTFTS